MICKSSKKVEHYRTIGDFSPVLINSSFPMIGLSDTSVNTNNDWLTCSFTREIAIPTQSHYYDLTDLYYILAAYGPLDPNGKQKKKKTKFFK